MHQPCTFRNFFFSSKMNTAKSSSICLYVLYYICFQYVSEKLGRHDHILINQHSQSQNVLDFLFDCIWFAQVLPHAAFFLLPVLYSLLPLLSSPTSLCSFFCPQPNKCSCYTIGFLTSQFLQNQSLNGTMFGLVFQRTMSSAL